MTIDEARSTLIATLKVLEQKRRESLLERARKAAFMADSYSRLDVVMSYYARLPRKEWFALLGEQWSCCDNIAQWRYVLRQFLAEASRAELDAMMEPDEREALARLPERITVYRGCYAINRPGLSWTTDRALAEQFPKNLRYRRDGEHPLLRIGTVRRERAVLKLDRHEQEIIAHYVRVTREEHLAP